MMSNLIVYAQLALVAGEAKKADGSCPDWPATYTDSTAGASCVCSLFGGKNACKDGDTCGLDDMATHGGGADDEACVPLCTVLTSADIGPWRNRWCKDSDGQMCWTEYAVASPGKKCPPMCPRGPGKATANCVCETVQDANGKYWAGAKLTRVSHPRNSRRVTRSASEDHGHEQQVAHQQIHGHRQAPRTRARSSA